MRNVLGFEVGIRNVEAIARATAECAEVGNIRCPKAGAEIGYELPCVGHIEDPADVATHSPGADRRAIGEFDAYIAVADAGTDCVSIRHVPVQVGEQAGLAYGRTIGK